MDQIEGMTEEVVNWVESIIEDRDSMCTAIKLAEESGELLHAIYAGTKNVGEECADILILLLDVAYLNNVDLVKAFNKKMAINKARSWSHRNGALKHENPCQQNA